MGPVTVRQAQGFTLIELMVVVAVLTVLLTLAAPGMQAFIANQRARTAAYDLLADLTLARSEAIKRNAEVVLGPVGAWSGGWTVSTVSGGEAIGQRGSLGSGVQITRAPASVTYDGAGRLSGAAATVRFELFDGDSHYRCITLDPSGLPSTQTRACP
jgi:type IV fimbrial biogenesis protein FimT